MNSVGIATQDLLTFAPTLVLAALGFLMLIFGMFFPRMFRETLAAIVLIGFAVAMFITIQNWSDNSAIYNGKISADKYTAGFTCLFINSTGLSQLLLGSVTE